MLEDFGMKKLGPIAAEDLLEVFVRRHEAASTLITTNRPTQDWGVFLGDVPAATAILDRFLAHAEIVQMPGKSYRLPAAHRRRRTPEGRGRCRCRGRTERAHRTLEIAARFPQAPTAILRCLETRTTKSTSRLRASTESDDTRAAYRVAAFQTFLSGRISTFGDRASTSPVVDRIF